MKTKKMRGIIILAAGLFFATAVFLAPCQAQTQEPKLDPNAKAQVQVLAMTNIYNAKIVSQEGNSFKLSFDINNRETVQTGIKYAVHLVEKDKRLIVDGKVFDESISLKADETVHRELAYSAPGYLSGTFQIWIKSETANGLPLAQALAGEVQLEKKTGYVDIIPETCYITVKGEDKKYTVYQGVDIKPEETITGTCDVKNNFDSNRTITPIFETFYRSAFGEKLSTEAQSPITLNAGEQKTLSFTLPKAQKPQAYDAVLTFQNEKKELISSSIAFHYVLRGASATIQNLRLDKDTYQKGDAASATFNWTPSADSFDDSRFGPTDIGTVTVELSIKDSQGQTCGTKSETLKSDPKAMDNINISIPITKDCQGSKVELAIKDQNGKILDQQTLTITNQKPSSNVPANQANTESNKRNLGIAVIFIFFFILAVILIVLAITKKIKKNTFKCLLFLLMASAFILGTKKEAEADTFSVQLIGGTPGVYAVNLDKPSRQYAPSEMITGSGSVSNISVCINGAAQTAGLWVNINGTGDELAYYYCSQWGCPGGYLASAFSIPAENSPGPKNAAFQGLAMGEIGGSIFTAFGFYNIPYTVLAPEPGICGSANGQSYADNATFLANINQAQSGNFTIPAGVQDRNVSFATPYSCPPGISINGGNPCVSYSTSQTIPQLWIACVFMKAAGISCDCKLFGSTCTESVPINVCASFSSLNANGFSLHLDQAPLGPFGVNWTANPACETFLCQKGTPSTLTPVLTATGWDWTCSGLYGGAAAVCHANLPPALVDGECAISLNGKTLAIAPSGPVRCDKGTPIDGSDSWHWTCQGSGGGNSPSCFAIPCACNPIRCADETKTCDVGSLTCLKNASPTCTPPESISCIGESYPGTCGKSCVGKMPCDSGWSEVKP